MIRILCCTLTITVLAVSPAAAASDRTWTRLAACESDNRWNINTGNGYYGGLQISQTTWDEAGGQRYAPRPDLATRAQQIAIAERIQKWQGWQAWPQCARQLGLIGARPPWVHSGT